MIPIRDNIPSKSFPMVNWLIILANGYIFYLELKTGSAGALQRFVNEWSLISKPFWSDIAGHWTRLITATFLHGGWMHIISNMLFLFIFGDNVEDQMGHFKYLLFYLVAGVLANLAQAFMTPTSLYPMIGASGAIAGVLGAYFFFYPHARVTTLFPILFFYKMVEMPAFIFLGVWFLLQTLNSVAMLSPVLVTKQTMGGVAWWAHAGGFISGILMAPMLGKKTGKFR